MTAPGAASRRGAVTLALLLVVGCTAADRDGQSSGSSSTGPDGRSATSSASAPPVSPGAAAADGTSTSADVEPSPETPLEGACYDLTLDEVTEPTSDHPPVPCADTHTTRTIHVGLLDTVVDGHLLAVDSAVAQEQVVESCSSRFARHVGGGERGRELSRLQVVWFSPTLEQSDRGATWFRCDVVLLGRPGALAPLPRRLDGILTRPGASEVVGLCGTAAPGTAAFERVVCSLPHSWKAMSTIPLADGRYPGVAAVRRAGESTCRDRVRRASTNPERFRYGWEWPTREQWQAGQRFGYCWAPD